MSVITNMRDLAYSNYYKIQHYILNIKFTYVAILVTLSKSHQIFVLAFSIHSDFRSADDDLILFAQSGILTHVTF